MNLKQSLLLFILLLPAVASRADEGMWMVNSISRALVLKMEDKGLKLSAKEIYNEDKISLKDAIVSLDFGCTGSMISEEGLLITNHHCAYSDVHSISTPEHNYLETGFFAHSRDEEIYIPGKSAYFLHRILDVTDEVEKLVEEEKAAGRPYGSRRISSVIERKYSKMTGYEASLSSMWSGSKYYLSLYEVYTDIRLVAAPGVSISAFGGDIDNWEWPQQKCDFAMYRIYASPEGKPAAHNSSNVPMRPRKYLTVSTRGLKEGDFTMVLGYPGRTARYSSAAKIDFRRETTLPISNRIRGEQMKIIKGWMDKDPEIRIKYADKYFSLSNIQENDEGFVQNTGRFGASRHIRREEKHKMRGQKRLLHQLDEKYSAVRDAERERCYFRETIVRGTGVGLIATRLKNNRRPLDLEKEYAPLDLRVERDLFRYALEQYFEGVSPKLYGPYQKELSKRFGKDYDAMCAFLWKDGWMSAEDPIFKFFTDVNITNFNKEVDAALDGTTLSELDKEYTRAKYRIRKERGEIQYPDANSTMRLTYGTVGSFKRNGHKTPVFTYASEILAKEDPASYDFSLLPDWKACLERSLRAGKDLPVNFISDNDITGGNSGSPVLDARGRLVGLAFDGNKESLASDVYWTPGYSKCINVDIRFVLWTLENYADMGYLLKEMKIN